ncbi:hypothetical protein DFS33DRAFT_1354577 [Desarmillaria ectypa]|nr:hypothetical protein DFS33DRAFT_1354577 [Desarmillaria ectypa]
MKASLHQALFIVYPGIVVYNAGIISAYQYKTLSISVSHLFPHVFTCKVSTLWLAYPIRTHHSRRIIWYQIVFLVKLCLIFAVGYILLAVLNMVILNAQQPISCPDASRSPSLTTADDATST